MRGFEEHHGTPTRLVFDDTAGCFKWVQLRRSAFDHVMPEDKQRGTPSHHKTK